MAENLKIVTWKWKSVDKSLKKRDEFNSVHVNTMYSMLQRHLHMPFEMVCITDDPTDIHPQIRCVPLWRDYRRVGGCFRRLRIFSDEMKHIIGARFASIDLDAVIVDDVTPIFSRTENFIIWGEHYRDTPYCGSLMMMNAGCRAGVWESFKLEKYPSNIRGRWPKGTDQFHISRCLYPEEVMWTSEDGVYNFNHTIRRWPQFKKGVFYRDSIFKRKRYRTRFLELGHTEDEYQFPRSNADGQLPDNARVIFFNGVHCPSDEDIQKEYPWVREHWN